jgi:hypothetical protein
MRNGRCRLHGGLSTGPKTQAGIEAIRKARTVHGHYSAAAIAQRRETREKRRQAKLESQRLRKEYRDLKALLKAGLWSRLE